MRLLLAFLIALALFTQDACAEFTSELRRGNTRVVLEDTRDEIELRIISRDTYATEVFSLSNPSRIVVDVRGLKLNTHRSTPLGWSRLIKGFRVSVSPRKVRFVLDMKEGIVPSFSSRRHGTEFVLSVREAGQKDIAAETPPAEPTSTPVAEAPQTPAATATVAPSVTIAATPEGRTLQAIAFDREGLRLEMSRESGFRLSKEQSFYLITIAETVAPAPQLLLPYYAPGDVPGINGVQAIQGEGELQIRIFVEPSTRLSAVRVGNTIRITGTKTN